MSQPSTATLTPDEQTLQSLLQAAIDVELFTIPLYLTAAYSLRFTNSDGTPAVPEPFPAPNGDQTQLGANQRAFNIIFTVSMQEMLHLMLACNLSSALGFPPTLNPPDYTTGRIPHIKQPPAEKNITIALGPLDADRLALFQYIETPDFPGESFPHTEPADGFVTIGALYKALRYWVNALWSQRYDPQATQGQQFQYGHYPSEYPHKTISGDSKTALDQANILIDEIVLQGEGADAADTAPADHQPPLEADIVPADFQPQLEQEEASKTPRESNDAKVRAYWDKYSHYARFTTDLAPLIKPALKVELWPTSKKDLPASFYQAKAELQAFLNDKWVQLLKDMTAAFADHLDARQQKALFPFTDMQEFNTHITNVWAAGGQPDFKPQS